MRKFFATCLILVSLASLVSYALWTEQRPMGHYLSDLRIRLAINEGQPGERGNLLGIEPELFPTDYQDLSHLHRKLAAYLQQARDQGLLNARTIVVLPEHIGTWLYAAGEKNQFYQAATVDESMDWLAWSNPLKFVTAMMTAEGEKRLDDARLRMKAHSMVRDYQNVFGGLAKEFEVTLVAGSIVLPNPRVEDGQLQIGSGALYNSSVTFGSDGKPLGQPQRQLFTSRYHKRYVKAAGDSRINVIDTPAGRLGILIGTDSWYPDNYARMNQQNVDLIVVPAFVNGKNSWSGAWHGTRTHDTPTLDLEPRSLSEREAWHRLTLIAREPQSTARAGISVFLHGQFWNHGTSGQSFVSRSGQTITEQPLEKAADGGARLINVWL
ncbi:MULTISPECIES: carbon-nitrogen hydrolase family protein [Pseudomonas syringae group]|uniref:carbon-nitrogen hydrolase family protein n=1 Tax=Pseudomonas syringae group TaxID=136849 RepID=UPI000F017093|nr:carbon-nitrogen hydrolase family protein [Pseudomonas viridiflava]MBD8572611.1 carbon-nitrogen hydrolase family protein [Pseudomonas syringae]MEE4099303.1 carbon-nitrogen hydrolase family protein [Pseudomonas viridiflava]